MHTRFNCLAASLVAIVLAGPAFGQTSNVPPPDKGTAADGSRPADGAIKGGAILPGERGGLPEDILKSRCADLTGTLKEECLAREREPASAGATGGARPPSAGEPPPTREAPPPQNPLPR